MKVPEVIPTNALPKCTVWLTQSVVLVQFSNKGLTSHSNQSNQRTVSRWLKFLSLVLPIKNHTDMKEYTVAVLRAIHTGDELEFVQR